jgi:hypothetical protein
VGFLVLFFMKSNKDLGIYSLPIAYLETIQTLIEKGKVPMTVTDAGYLGLLASKGIETGAFKYVKGLPQIVKVKDIKIIHVNTETFKIQVQEND